ncbi:unnamed protein product [marine sediment metagenome]|uniref:Uncharacterized protein n=1 Tax=marine sediment metagenome TaxID=412755 RepID=X1JHD4_9ZZZZ
MNLSKQRYDGKHRVTRIFLDDYLRLKGLSQRTGQSMAEALHTIITRDWAMAQSVKPVTSVRIPVPITTRAHALPMAKAVIGSTNVKLRVAVAKGGSSNGFKQV